VVQEEREKIDSRKFRDEVARDSTTELPIWIE